MVNNEDFSKRLHQVMEYYQLSAAGFADAIHVGRSSISHILSGRNKPSLEFVMKIIDAFDEVDLYWLLNGKGGFPKSSTTKIEKIEDLAPSKISATKNPEKKTEDLFSTYTAPLPSILENNIPEKNSEHDNIERIVIFYTDGSFKSYVQK